MNMADAAIIAATFFVIALLGFIIGHWIGK